MADCIHEARGPHGPGAGHRQVGTTQRGRLHGPDGSPVGNHQTVESPFALQNLRHEVRLDGRGAVDPIVGGHDAEATGFDDRFERGQVGLPQYILWDHRVRIQPVRFGLVRDEVFGCGGRALGLDSPHHGRPHDGREVRVLAERFEVAAAVRGALKIDHRAKDDIHALASRFRADNATHGGRHASVERCCQRRRRRDIDGGVRLGPPHAADSHGSVGENQGAQPDRFIGVGAPVVLARQQPDLGFQVQAPKTGHEFLLEQAGRGNGNCTHGRHLSQYAAGRCPGDTRGARRHQARWGSRCIDRCEQAHRMDCVCLRSPSIYNSCGPGRQIAATACVTRASS
ncbi:hypothetical protein PJL18_01243 [Paenarthrobacter nicotinovorans]|nr:hypothetical protein [Paenarthrobacter nicotinovorans]